MPSPPRTAEPPHATAGPPAPRPSRSPETAPGSFLQRIARARASWSSRRGTAPVGPILEEFAGVVAEAIGPAAVASALVRLAHRAAGPAALGVELHRGRGVVAAWPEGTVPAAGAAVLDVPLRSGGRWRGSLRVALDPARPLGEDRRRALAALAAIAAAADAALAVADEPEPAPTPARAPGPVAHPPHDPATGLPNAFFFETFLTYALALADRREEPLSLFYIGVDRLAAIRGLHGDGVACEALRRVGRTVARCLRGSDLVARLDEGRLVAVLPGASTEDARRIAEHLRATIATAGVATTTMPVLTASIGVATFPESAGDTLTLRSAAAAALAEARSRGRDHIVIAPPARLAEPATVLRIVQHAG